MTKLSGVMALCLLTSPVFAISNKTRPCEGAPGSFRTNPVSSLGGFVASTATVGPLPTLSPETQVCQFAVLKGAVKVMDRAIVSGRTSLMMTLLRRSK